MNHNYKLHVVIPTIMSNPAGEFMFLERITKQFDSAGVDFKIYFVANIPILEFNEYIPTDSRVIKSISNLEFSISRAINSVYESIEFEDTDILGFIQSDTYFENDMWVLDIIDIINNPKLNAGVVGLRPHASCTAYTENGISINDKFNIYPSNFTDGVMLFTGKVFRDVGAFDEMFFGDCESQDFCYRCIENGYINYWCKDTGYFGYKNYTLPFENKARFNKIEFLTKVEESRKYLAEKYKNK